MTLCGASHSWSTNLPSCLFIQNSNKRKHLEKFTCISAEGQGEECIYLGPTQCLASAYFHTPYFITFHPILCREVLLSGSLTLETNIPLSVVFDSTLNSELWLQKFSLLEAMIRMCQNV